MYLFSTTDWSAIFLKKIKFEEVYIFTVWCQSGILQHRFITGTQAMILAL